MSERALALPGEHAPEASTSGRRFVIPRNEIPVELLVARHDPRKVPASALCSNAELRQARSDAVWAGKREHLLAAAAAGFHVALFAWNLAFWGFEGMPPDRYWPDNPRIKLGLRPGRYGHMAGAKKLWYTYLEKFEGGGMPQPKS